MSDITVTNSFIENIAWKSSAECQFTVDGTAIDIWKIDVEANIPFIDQFSSVLTPDEIARAKRYLRQQDHDSFIVSRGALRSVLSKYLCTGASAIRFQPGKNNKPFISLPETGIQFNLTDSYGIVMIAVATREIGVDVEYIKPQFHYDDILPLNFNQPEIDYIKETDQLNRFFMLWTRKEALLKATGIGLTDHLTQMRSLDGQYTFEGDIISSSQNWLLSSFIPQNGYIATIANTEPEKILNYFQYNF